MYTEKGRNKINPANTSTKHDSPLYRGVPYLAKVFVIATAFQEFTFIVEYCPVTSTWMHVAFLR